MVKLILNKYNFYFTALVFFAVIIGICSVLLFISVSMNYDIIHRVIARTHPIARNIFIIALLIAIGSASLDWISLKHKYNKNEYPPKKNTDNILWGVAIIVIVCISLLPALICWSKADSNYYNIGGLIPWSDAKNFYSGAENLLQTGKFDSWNQRRPLNAALLAVRLAVTGNNFQYALLVQGVLFGLACFSATYVVAQIFNFSAGCIMFSVVFAYAATCLPTTMSECLGITLGLLAFSLLCYGIYIDKQTVYFSGLVVLTLALLARAGPMLVLPVLVIYAGFIFRSKHRYSWRAMGIASICIIFGFFINYCLLWLYGDGSGIFLGNFSHTFYGLAVGGKGWKQIYLDYPQAYFMPEAELMNFIYSKAWEKFLSNPFMLLKAYFGGLFSMPLMLVGHLSRLIVFQNDGNSPYNLLHVIIAGIVLFPFFLVGLVRFLRLYRDHIIFQFMSVVLFAFFLSLPIIYKDGAMRTIAATFPFIAAFFALATIGWRKTPLTMNVKMGKIIGQNFYCFWLPTLVAAILVSSAILGPWFFSRLSNKSNYKIKDNCPTNQQTLVMRIGPGLPYLEIDKYTRHTFVPSVDKKDFSILDRNEAAHIFRKITPPATLLLAYDQNTKMAQYLVAPPGFVGKQWEEKLICAQNEGTDQYKLWRLKAVSP